MRRRQFLAGLAASATTLAAPALALSPEHKRLLGAGANSPSLDLSFLNTGSLDGRITFTRASNATYFDTTGTLQTAATNVPRFDNDPVTLASLGLLIEEQRTNSIRNPRAEGAVVGTPGTLPTNWYSDSLPGWMTRTVVGASTQNGIPCFDVRFQGTPTSTAQFGFGPEQLTGFTPAANGQTWAASSYTALVAGSTANAALSTTVDFRNAGGSALAGTIVSGSTATNTTGSLSRNFLAATATDATTAYVDMLFRLNFTINLPIDFTLRIGAPQLELGAFATSVILPPAGTPAAATRAADVATIPTGSWFNANAGTLIARGRFNRAPAAVAQGYAELNDGTSNNRIALFLGGAGLFPQSVQVAGGITGASEAAGSQLSSGVSATLGATFNAQTLTFAVNGALIGSAAMVGYVGSALTTLQIGAALAGAAGRQFNGWLERIDYYPRMMISTELQQRTT